MKREDIADRLAKVGYVADSQLAMALWLMESLARPVLLEGAAGVGKTEVAKALAQIHDTRLIRLQCYEGLDANENGSAHVRTPVTNAHLVFRLMPEKHNSH